MASINFDAPTAEDAYFLGQLSASLQYNAEDYRQTKRDEWIWTDPITRRSAKQLTEDAWMRLDTEIASMRDELKEQLEQTNNLNENRAKLFELEAQLQNARQSLKSHKPTMVHYEDKTLGQIAPKMTRYYEFEGEGKSEWLASALILDHVTQGAEGDKAITTSQ